MKVLIDADGCPVHRQEATFGKKAWVVIKVKARSYYICELLS